MKTSHLKPSPRFALRPHALPRHLRTLSSITILAASGLLICSSALAATRLPRATLPNVSTMAQVSGRFNTSSGGTPTNPVLNIRQLDAAGILQWGTFDIGADATVNIDQPSSTSTLLNKVSGGLIANKTVIEGLLKANGQVYIYNPNGIIFGKTSRVNVNSLVATTLKIDDKRFLAGLLSPSTTPFFSADPDAKSDGVLVGTPGAVMVEGVSGSQAHLTAATGGKIMLVAPTVVNNGILSAPGGQVALAAGNKVYLASPSDIRMRGLRIEVNNDAVVSALDNPDIQAAGSTATNDVLGTIKVGTGNATLVGLAVNQMGTISATTSVNINGSIYLHANDGASQSTATSYPTPTHSGTLVLGANSLTEILPTLDDATTTSGTSFNASKVDLSGNSVHLLSNARIVAPAGEVDIVASATASALGTVKPHAGSNVTLDAGALIDVSGTTATQLAMESNVIQVDLRGTEFADDVLLRNSALRGKTVSVDARKGNLLFANIQGWLDLAEYNVGQRTAIGGTVSLQADGQVNLNSGSTIDVSGGLVTYLPGNVATTQLTYGRRRYDISTATASLVYDGVVAAAASRRNFEAGYIQGYSAGTISVAAPAIALDGTLRGTVTPGPKQRNLSSTSASASRPLGGQLIIGNPVALADDPIFFYKGAITLGHSDSGLALDPLALTGQGFTRLGIYTEGAITVNTGINLAPGGALTLVSGKSIELASNIDAPGGKLTASAKNRITVDAGVDLDVSGLWTNDRVASGATRTRQGSLVAPIVTQGGSIGLTAPIMAVGSNAQFDASGGAWLNSSAVLSAGTGGSISVSATTDPAFSQLTIGAGASFSAYGLSTGGKLTLSGHNITLGASTSDLLDLGLPADFFEQGGFASYDIRAAGNLTVLAGTTVAPRMDNWLRTRATARTASGAMSNAFGLTTLPLGSKAGSRNATSLSLSALPQDIDSMGRLDLQAGARIITDPGATVSLSAGRQLTVDGMVKAPGGAIKLALTTAIASVAYRPERSIWIGSQAMLDASGTSARLWQDGSGFTHGSILDGGSIKIGQFTDTTLGAAPGYVVIEDGALLDVSGTASTMTLKLGTRAGTDTRTVASAGGSIDIWAREGLLIEGTLLGAGGNASASGGSLSLILDRQSVVSTTGYPDNISRNLLVASSGSGFPVAGAADKALTGWEGKGFVTASTLNNGGFDWINLKSQNLVSFDLSAGSLVLAARSGLIVDAPQIAAAPGALANSTVTLAAPYVELGNSDWRYQASAPAASASLAGGIALHVKADTVDLIGTSTLKGFDAANINAAGDIRLVGQIANALTTTTTSPLTAELPAAGGLEVAGTMALTSSQLYPTTMSKFTLAATGSNSHITFNGNNNVASMPLSAAGSLTVKARTIDQNGVVRAPLGTIDFEASDALNYGAGSLTSVAASGLIPLGLVLNGRDWLYDFGNGNTINLSDSTASNYVALPDKKIISHAPSVNFARGAVQDLSGGGDLYAYEFTPGPGGTKDVLAATSGTTATVFAILPGYTSSVAPRDFQYAQDSGLKTGDSIYLSGIAGLAAGYYTLLPAHYALMSGAYMVSAAAGSTDMVAAANTAKRDGSYLVSGYRSALGGGASNRSSGFLVTSAALVRQESEFTDYSANSLMTSLVTAPRDGGHVVFDVTKSLTLDGVIRLGAASGGSNGIADISAPEITVVSQRSDPLPAESATGTLKLAVGDLRAIGADSLLLGAVRSATSAGDTLTVGANNVIIDNDAAHTLTGPEIIIAATDSVILKTGSAVAAQGVLSRTPKTLIISNNALPSTDGAGVKHLNNDGALLRVSNGAQVAIQRSYTAANGTVVAPVTGSLATGTLLVESNVALAASGSVMLDATKSNTIDSILKLGSGTALGLGAARISLGDDAPSAADVLRFDTNALLALNSLSSLALSSYSTIDIYGTVNLGSTAMRTLSLAASGMRGMSGADTPQATFTARTIRLDHAGTADTTAGVSTGSVAFNATNIEIGNGAFALQHFTTATLNASNEIRAVGTDGVLNADGRLMLKAARITARGGDNASFNAANQLILTQGSGAVGTLPALEFGGKLAFQGQTITSNADITALAGQVNLSSTGGIELTGGTISAAGGSETFGSTVAYAPAGSITLDGGAGDVRLGSNATLDVSASGAAAGTISLKAISGQAIVKGKLKGSSDAGQTQGSFVMDVNQFDPDMSFGALNAKLNSSGFGESRSFRLRNTRATPSLGDIALLAGELITAHQVVVAADNGNITIGGTIDANGAKGGSIALYAAEAAATATSNSGNITLENTARLYANARTASTSTAGSTGDGGHIILGTSTADGSSPIANADGSIKTDASISISTGALLDVSGKGLGDGGSVLLRAPRLNSNDDVAIAALDAPASIKGSSSTVIEAYRVYNLSGTATISANADDPGVNLDATTGGIMYTDAKTLMDNSSAILSRLDPAGSGVVVNPGVEVRSTGSLSVSVNEDALTANAANRGWNLNTWHFGNQPGVLTLRAAGDLTIKGSISDGFVSPGTTTAAKKISMPDWALDPSGDASWSYRLVGGSDLAAANPLATVAGAGNFKLTFARLTGTAATGGGASTTQDLPVALVRTGTGFIDVAAGNNVLLDTLDVTTKTLFGGVFPDLTTYKSTDILLGASIYTAGRATSLTDINFTAPTDYLNTAYGAAAKTSTDAAFTSGGGSISILAQNDVVGTVTNQMINNWLFRQGRISQDNTFDTKSGSVQNTAWWSRSDYFNQGIATFGGGDISVIAETGNVSNVSASIATNAYLPSTDSGGTTSSDSLAEQGGGDLVVRAGGDIRGGSFYVQKGSAVLNAADSIVAGDHIVTDNKTATALGTILAAGDAQFSVTAGNNLLIEGIFNPTMTGQSINNVTTAPSDPYTQVANKLPDQYGVYSTYGADSAVSLVAVAGDLTLSERGSAMRLAGGSEIRNSIAFSGTAGDVNTFLPGSLFASSLSGDLIINNGFSLAPSATGQLDLLAKSDVLIQFLRAGKIVMMDLDPSAMPTALDPAFMTKAVTSAMSGVVVGLPYHTSSGLHASDPDPVRIIALDGDISSSGANNNIAAAIILPKKAEISAGRDIANLGFDIQQLSSADITTVTAGRDITNSTLSGGSNISEVVTGPGRVDFTAGRNFDLGNSAGVVTRGNLENPYLPESGASVNIVAGAGAGQGDYATFAARFATLADFETGLTSSASSAFEQALVAFVGKYNAAVTTSTAPADAWIAFAALPTDKRTTFLDTQKPLVNTVFFKRLVEAPVLVSTGVYDLTNFDSLIASLYPIGTIKGGDINVFGSQVKTERGGSIDFFAPGGSVYAGLTSVPAYLSSKSPSTLGIFTIKGGEIAALVKTDFLVNQGRVFTLGGGDITLISQYGNIDAGKGAKTAQATPPPILKTDKDGNTVVDISGSISGSGIATLQGDASAPIANVYPIAPRGIFDAGDAGVRSSGTVNIVAATVLNASNIAATGGVSGAPAADTSGLSAAAAAPANTTQTKTDDITKSLETQSASSGTLSVEVIGFGGDQQAVTQGGQNPPAATEPSSPEKPNDDDRKKSRKQQ